jgi:glycosyltransferase involved in cell wall biosynthesis
VQDGWLAWWCRQYRRAGLVRTQELLANGTEEELPFLRRFRYVQQLAPWHLEQARAALVPAAEPITADWTMMPNFVDVDRFRPDPAARAALRQELGLPADAVVICGAAALQRQHKRVDYVIEEFARLLAEPPGGPAPYLLLAGADTADTPALEAQATALAPGRVRVLRNVARERMPALYAAADLGVLASLFEMLGIVLLEAMACGVPVIAHAHPVLQWVVGPGGATANLEPPGALAEQLRLAATPEWCRRHAPLARAHVVARFAPDVVVPQYEAWYEQVVSARRR